MASDHISVHGGFDAALNIWPEETPKQTVEESDAVTDFQCEVYFAKISLDKMEAGTEKDEAQEGEVPEPLGMFNRVEGHAGQCRPDEPSERVVLHVPVEYQSAANEDGP
jgi:hypothetical protein